MHNTIIELHNLSVDILGKMMIFLSKINPKIREDVLRGWDVSAYGVP